MIPLKDHPLANGLAAIINICLLGPAVVLLGISLALGCRTFSG
jgi:hypothetical protein